MKTDLNSLKKELGRLTDVNYLKKELNRIAAEVKNFDVHPYLTPQARTRLERLEKRFRELLKSLTVLQKQVDTNLVKLKKIVKPSAGRSTRKAKPTTKRATARKTTRKAAKTTRKSAK